MDDVATDTPGPSPATLPDVGGKTTSEPQREPPLELRGLPPKQQVAAPVHMHAELQKAQKKNPSRFLVSPVPGDVEAIVKVFCS